MKPHIYIRPKNARLKYKIQVNVEAELEGAAGDLGRMAVWDQIQVRVWIQDGLYWTKAEFYIMQLTCTLACSKKDQSWNLALPS